MFAAPLDNLSPLHEFVLQWWCGFKSRHEPNISFGSVILAFLPKQTVASSVLREIVSKITLSAFCVLFIVFFSFRSRYCDRSLGRGAANPEFVIFGGITKSFQRFCLHVCSFWRWKASPFFLQGICWCRSCGTCSTRSQQRDWPQVFSVVFVRVCQQRCRQKW